MLQTAFILITFLSVIGLYFSSGKDTKTLIIFCAWTGLVGLLSASGFYQNTEALPPRIITVLIPSVFIVTYLYKVLELEQLKTGWLIAVHVLRIPVELILFELYQQGQVPALMTLSGWNFDIVSGLTSIVVLALYMKGKLSVKLLLTWNVIALSLLVAIVAIALLSAPTPIQQFAFDEPNIAPLYFPFTFLPAVVVPIVLLSHLLLFRSALNQGLTSNIMS